MSIFASSNFGIPTPPSVCEDNLCAKNSFFPPFSKKNDEHFYSDSPSSTNGMTETYSSEPARTPYRSPDQDENQKDPGMIFRFPVVFSDNKSSPSSSSSSLQNTPAITVTEDPFNNSNDNDDVDNQSSTLDYYSTKAIPTPSATIIHRPLLLPDVVRSINQSRRSKLRSRPITRAKNKKEDQFNFNTGLDLLFDVAISTNQSFSNSEAHQIHQENLLKVPRHNSSASSQSSTKMPINKFLSRSSGRNPHTSNGATTNNSSRASTTTINFSSPSTGHFDANNSNAANTSFYYIAEKRRTSTSLSSLSSMPTSDLSDLDADYGDDEDDFSRNSKQIKYGTGSGLGITITPATPSYNNSKNIVKTNNNSLAINTNSAATITTTIINTTTARERKDTNHRTKVCASCRTKSTPCWRPGWRPDLFLCNSCGLRYKKTKCVCPNLDCRYIPLKSEFNAMFKKQKNGGDIPDAKRCCKCASFIANNGNWRV
ncbi:7240_t:CDS:2 [Ambispora leptoticha]|uniref:7240_t:CDS:1 n=1 Tax=Ambispora leptoticha TaxID=144679 RepID=A0A9N9EYQ7_9GLOM|nr:7240_t:CDS:2 [Ambispora leptoticha]